VAIISRRIFLAFVCLATISVVLLCNGVQTARADVPFVMSIENLSQGTTGKIKLTIHHMDGTSTLSAHYVDIVEVDVDGKVKQFTYDNPLQNSPFVVELDLGTIKASSVVKARAHCIIYGWGAWSDAVPVPEFPVAALVSIVALAATLLIMKRQSQIRR